MPELSVQQCAAILECIREDLMIFDECCEECSVDFEETLATLKALAGEE
ncbi:MULTISPECIES: hypothetical protein [unclassified Pantoea]